MIRHSPEPGKYEANIYQVLTIYVTGQNAVECFALLISRCMHAPSKYSFIVFVHRLKQVVYGTHIYMHDFIHKKPRLFFNAYLCTVGGGHLC